MSWIDYKQVREIQLQNEGWRPKTSRGTFRKVNRTGKDGLISIEEKVPLRGTLKKQNKTKQKPFRWWMPFAFAVMPTLSNPRLSSQSTQPRAVVLRVCSLDQNYQHHLRTCCKCKFLDSSSDLLNQELWGWGLDICILTSSLGELLRVKLWE